MFTVKNMIDALEDNLVHEVTDTLAAYQKANRLDSARKDPASAIYRMDVCYEVWRAHNLAAGRSVTRDVPFFIHITVLNGIARSDFFKAVQD